MDCVTVWKSDPRGASVNLELGRAILSQEAHSILHLAERLDESFDNVVDLILDCKGKVVTCGIGKSGHIARKAAGTFSSTGTPSAFLHAAEAVHGDLGLVTSGDVVILYTQSGETDEIVRLFPSLRTLGAQTVVITGRERSSAAREADVVLSTLVETEACPNNLAPTTSTTVMLALGDAIALTVMDRRGFTSDDFAKLHPSGTLGKRLLLTVRDVMRKRDEIAVCSPSDSFLTVTKGITNHGVGASCVVNESDELLGLISDGDIRRALSSERPLTLTAEQLMTKTVTTISGDLLAIDGLEFFQNLRQKLGELPVVESGRVVGLLMLKDLLRSGII